jgi:hypothetical protein
MARLTSLALVFQAIGLAVALPASQGSTVPAAEQWLVALKPEVSSDSDLELHARWVSELHAKNVQKRDDAPAGLEKTFQFPGFSAYVGSFDEDTLDAIKHNPNVSSPSRINMVTEGF